MHAVSLTPDAQVVHAVSLSQSKNDSNGPWQPTPPLKKYINLKGLPNKIFVHWHRMHVFCVRKSIITRRIRSRIQNGFSPESGVQGYCLMKKTEGRKSRDNVPLNLIPTITGVILQGCWTDYAVSGQISDRLDIRLAGYPMHPSPLV
jgi:hypothetical protein